MECGGAIRNTTLGPYAYVSKAFSIPTHGIKFSSVTALLSHNAAHQHITHLL